MDITLSPSPNHDERKHPVDMIVLHYTGMQTGQAAFDQLRNPDAKVSSHYLLWEDGRVEGETVGLPGATVGESVVGCGEG